MKRMIKTIICALSILAFVAAPVSAEYNKVDNTVLRFASDMNGDVNGDGIVNSLDAALVLQYDAGLIDEFANKAETHVLTDEMRERIISNFLKRFDENEYQMEVSDIAYYGTYNGWDAVAVTYSYGTDVEWVDCLGHDIVIAGYQFFIPHYFGTMLCKDDNFYDLDIAYRVGILTKEDVYNIGVQLGILPWTAGEALNHSDNLIKRNYGDANGDGKISNLDASVIMKYDAGLLGD